MAQVWIDIEENDNCGYFPMQTFEARGEVETSGSVTVDEFPGRDGSQEIVGWCSDDGGSPCEVSVVLIGDSGAGESRLVSGGDYGVRIRDAGTGEEWSVDSVSQQGEPYVLLNSTASYLLND